MGTLNVQGDYTPLSNSCFDQDQRVFIVLRLQLYRLTHNQVQIPRKGEYKLKAQWKEVWPRAKSLASHCTCSVYTWDEAVYLLQLMLETVMVNTLPLGHPTFGIAAF